MEEMDSFLDEPAWEKNNHKLQEEQSTVAKCLTRCCTTLDTRIQGPEHCQVSREAGLILGKAGIRPLDETQVIPPGTSFALLPT